MDVKELRQFAGEEVVQDVFEDLHIELAATVRRCNILEAENKDLREQAAKPIDALLFCPNCDFQHIDQPQPEKDWDNPPHRSHECQRCGYIWRPADVPTNGVAEIQTKGTADSPFRPQTLMRENEYWQRDTRRVVESPPVAPVEQKTEYVASNDVESFSAPKAETPEAAIAEAVEYHGMEVGDTVWVGEVRDYGNGEQFYPDGGDIIDRMCSLAQDEASEWAESWLDKLPEGAEKELTEGIRDTIRNWIVKHKLHPQFFTVEKVTERQVEADGAA